MTNQLRSLFVFSLLIPACAVDANEPSDGIDDSFADGKRDSGGIVDGTPEARAVIRLVNTASLDMLDNEIPLDSRAAKNIVAFRAGADGVEPTADDRRFTTLAELDAISYVGPIALSQLLHHVRAQTWRDLFPADFALDLRVPVPTHDISWHAHAPGGPYLPRSEEDRVSMQLLKFRDRDGEVEITFNHWYPPTLIEEDGTFHWHDSWSGPSGPDDRYSSWGSRTIDGYIDPLGEVVITRISDFSGYGNNLFGYHGSKSNSTAEGRAPLPEIR